jgi:hypothetical protein
MPELDSLKRGQARKSLLLEKRTVCVERAWPCFLLLLLLLLPLPP